MKRHYYLLILAILLASCNKDNSPVVTEMASEAAPKLAETGVTLGAHLTNAYAIKYMRQAYTQLYGSGAETAIQPTHYYAKIDLSIPEVLDRVIRDTTIDAFPFPLDYELVGTGEYNPPAGEEQWAYAVIPAGNHILSKSHLIIIDTCYIPPQDNEKLMAVEERALIITGNLDPDKDTYANDYTKQAQKCLSGRPSGILRVKNTKTGGWDLMRNVKVVMNSLVRVSKTYTSAGGLYSGKKKFYTDVCYTIFYEDSNYYHLWFNNLCFLPATTFLGIHDKHGYSADIDTNGYGWYKATINNAFDTYLRDLAPHFGILPPVNGLRIMLLPIGGGWKGSTPMFRHLSFSQADAWNYVYGFMAPMLNGFVAAHYLTILPDVLYLGNIKNTEAVFETMFHELSHVSHYAQVGNPYWSHFVGNVILNHGYGGGTQHSGYIGVGEMWGYYSGFKLSEYYWHAYHGVSPDSTSPAYTYWFSPYRLWLTEKNIDELNYSDIFDCLLPTTTTICDLKNEIKYRVSQSHYGYVNWAFSPWCN